MSCMCKGRTHVCPTILNSLTRWTSNRGIWNWVIKTHKGTTYVVLEGYIK